jgi:hypothetical protein
MKGIVLVRSGGKISGRGEMREWKGGAGENDDL